jgi:hypothetical protein
MTGPSAEVSERPLFVVGIAGSEWAPRTLDEVREWLTAESKEWGWLRTLPSQDNTTNSFASVQFHGETDLNHYISLLMNDAARREELAPQIQGILDRRFNIEKAIYSKTPVAQYVLSLKQKDAKIAAHTGHILIGRDPEGSRSGFMASALAANYMFGPQSVPESAAMAWAKIVEAISEGQAKLRTEAGAAADEWRTRRDDITNLHNHQRDAFEADQGKRTEGFTIQTGEHEKRMDQIEETFKTGQSLKAAVTYFTTKGTEHAAKAKVFAWSAGIAGALIAAGVALSPQALGNDPKPAQIGVAFALAFLALWLLRVLVRLFFSNTHLSTDMKTRATLVETYLALIQEGGGIADKDRARIVDLVFRPASDGLVKEDGTPPTLFSLFQRGATGG